MKMAEEKLIQLRKKIKAKKPNFVRQDSHKQAEVKKNWRKPKGLQSKMRLRKKGYRKSVAVGYGSPKKVYGLHPKGLQSIIIKSIKEIENIDPKTQGIIISKTLGQKKKVELIKKAKEKAITILNVKDADKFLKQVEDKLKTKQEEKRAKEAEKAKKKKESEKKGEEKEKLDEKLSEDEKKEKEKEEKEKVLTKKGA
jgi:large subunit ribosomal protein L32e